jgi:hypothetical protein
MEAIQTQWPNYCTDPAVDDVGFWDVETPNQKYVELEFEAMPDVRDLASRPLGWGLIPILGYVNIHIYVRGDTVESMPADMVKVVNAVEHIVEKERKNLIPHSQFVTIDRSLEVKRQDKNRDRWHWYCSVMISYTKVVT